MDFYIDTTRPNITIDMPDFTMDPKPLVDIRTDDITKKIKLETQFHKDISKFLRKINKDFSLFVW